MDCFGGVRLAGGTHGLLQFVYQREQRSGPARCRVLYCFNGKSKLLEEMGITGVPSGSYVDAKLSQDEKYIMLTVRQGKLDKLYRLNTMNRNIVDMDKSTIVVEEEEVVEEKTYKPVEKKPEVPQITEPLPEAAFADEPTGAGHEVKKETAEPKKSL